MCFKQMNIVSHEHSSILREAISKCLFPSLSLDQPLDKQVKGFNCPEYCVHHYVLSTLRKAVQIVITLNTLSMT